MKKIIHHIHASFSLKVFFVSLLFIVTISLFFVVFFTYKLSVSLKGKLIDEGYLLTRLLSHNSRIGVFIEDDHFVKNAVNGVIKEPVVISAALFNDGGDLIIEKSKNNEKEAPLPDPRELKKIFAELIKRGRSLYIEKTDTIEFWEPMFSDKQFLTFSFDEIDLVGVSMVTVTKEILYEKRKQLILNSTLITCMFLSLGFIMTYLSVKRITRPIMQLTETVKEYGSGLLPKALPVHRKDEIGQLAAAFNEMVSTLNDKEKERKKLEDHTIKTQKLEAIGLLAGGIAHDFNNMMTAFTGKITLAKERLKKDAHYSEQKMEEALGTISLVKDLSMQLLTLSKGGVPADKRVTQLSELADKAASFILGGSNIQHSISSPDDLPACLVDRGMITQVFNNILINAMEAMPGGGVIRIMLETIVLEKNTSLPLNGGTYVAIKIVDTGAGIPEETLESIFTPFYTTKREGNGLGLATALSIIKKHKGFIDVESTIGEGTTFFIYLPTLKEKPETGASLEGEDEKTLSQGMGEKILFMDDNKDIRECTAEMLEIAGYEVEPAADGKEAIALYKNALSRNEPFYAVILDLTITGKMGGQEVLKELLRIDPDVKAIVASGYNTDPVMRDYRSYGFKGIVTKPYSIDELRRAIDKVISNG